MTLAKLTNHLLLFRLQFFGPRKEKEGRLPGGQRSSGREPCSFRCILLAFWKPPNQMITHTCIGSLVTSCHEGYDGGEPYCGIPTPSAAKDRADRSQGDSHRDHVWSRDMYQ